MTEGVSLLFLTLGLMVLQSSFDKREPLSFLFAIFAGILIALSILHRQIWVLVLCGLGLIFLYSFWKDSLVPYRKNCIISIIVTVIGVFVFTLLAAGVFIGGGGQSIALPHLALGNWLLSFMAFLPLYGLGLYTFGSTRRDGISMNKYFIILWMIFVGVLTSVVALYDPAHSWLGVGPVKQVLRILGLQKWELVYLFVLGSMGLCLLASLIFRILTNSNSDFRKIFITGCLGGIFLMVAGSLFPTTFYERYMFSPLFCILLLTSSGEISSRAWLSQCALFLIFQFGVNYHNGLFYILKNS